jgi:hypothetical protein
MCSIHQKDGRLWIFADYAASATPVEWQTGGDYEVKFCLYRSGNVMLISRAHHS